MSGNERPEKSDQTKLGSSGPATPDSIRYDEVMKGQGERQPRVSDASTTRAADVAYLNSPAYQAHLEEARQHLSPEVRNSMVAAVSVPAELKKNGITDPAEQAAYIEAKQQEQIDNYAKTIGGKSHEEQVAEVAGLVKYMDKMGKILENVQNA